MGNTNLHTCEKAAPGWDRTGPCEECKRVESFRATLGTTGYAIETDHWRARAEQAEAENAKLQARVEELQRANTKQALHIINLGGRISELEIQRKTLHALIDDLIAEREKWKPALEAQMKQAREFAERVMLRGHYDTCSHMLSDEYDCTCPFTDAVTLRAVMDQAKQEETA